jgi:hypothetical protein
MSQNSDLLGSPGSAAVHHIDSIPVYEARSSRYRRSLLHGAFRKTSRTTDLWPLSRKEVLILVDQLACARDSFGLNWHSAKVASDKRKVIHLSPAEPIYSVV